MRTRTPPATPEQAAAIAAGIKRLGLTMNEFARRVNLIQGRIKKIVNGGAPLTERSRALLEGVLGVLP